MSKVSKRKKNWADLFPAKKTWRLLEAIQALKEASNLAKVKFEESFDVAIRLGIDPKKSDQTVRGAALMPHGIGKTVRVAVLSQGAASDAAREAGADEVGFDDLAQNIQAQAQQGKFSFDVLIATPDAMRLIVPLGRVLGPAGLMPNPRLGTVTVDPAAAVKKAKAGQVTFKSEKAGIVHCSIGKLNFDSKALEENLAALIAEVRRLKPSTSKGVYLCSAALSSTMGPGLRLEMSEKMFAG